MAEKITILFVDDNSDFLASTSRGLSKYFNVITASDIPSAQKRALEKINAVLLDIRLDDSVKENRDGLELLSWFKDEFPQISVVMMTSIDEVDVAVEAMKLGASDYIVKSRLHIRELVKSINNAVEKSQLKRKIHSLERRLERLESQELIGESLKMLAIKRVIDAVAADGKIAVLIRGETGTGKELVALAIHDRGIRKDGPFVAVSLSDFPKEILSSELFGREKGAFTDAKERRIGYVEEADGGVLFLDEIGELTPDVQVTLLRVLETHKVTRLGSTTPIPVDFQLVAATNLNLEQAVTEGKIRKDFYFRLKHFVIHLPPLAERKEEIPLLANHFLQRLNRQGRTTIQQISPEALEYLIAYDWPGNVRELEHCIESAIVKATKIYKDDVILPSHLPDEVRARKQLFGDHQEELSVEIPDEGIDIDEKLARMELAYIEEALKQTDGKKTDAWKLLGYNDRYKIKKRVDSILRRFPELSEQFYLIKKKYKE